MKLISCYIENFGGLSQYAQDFEEGLTVIQAPNGFGKTTLAEFIRAMFYGFPRKTPRQMGKRQKYRPWSGVKCRGHLTFEHEGVQYRIERTFGATPKGDSCKIFDLQTGQETSRFSEEVGLELFGLDADSFERSTYLPQSREVGSLTTDSIRAKLGDLVEDANDVGNFEKAMNALRLKRSSYIPYRGAGGAVAEDTDRITRIQQALDSAEESARDLTRAETELAELAREQDRVGAQIEMVRRDLTAANEAAARLARHQEHDRLTASLTEAEAQLAVLEKKYPHGLPDQQALEAMTDAVDLAVQLAGRQVITAEDQRAQRFVEEHEVRFGSGVPDEVEFDAMRRTWDDHRTANAQLEACVLPEAEAAELAAMEAFFAPGVPGEDTLRRMEADLEQAERLRRENQRLATQTAAAAAYKVPSPLTVPLLLGIGAVAAVAGIVMLARSVFAPGGVTLALGVLALLGAAYLSLRTAMNRQTAGVSPQIQALIRENEEQAAALEGTVRAFTAAYADAPPAEIRRRGVRLAALRHRETGLSEKRKNLEVWQTESEAVLKAFFEKYCCRPEGDPSELLNRLQRAADAWERAKKQLADRDERMNRHRRETEEVRQKMEAFRVQYGMAPQNRSQVLALRDDARRIRELGAAVRTLEKQVAAYRREHAEILASPVAAVGEDPAALGRREAELLARQSRLAEDLLRLGQKARLLGEAAERIPELRDELSRWQEKKIADQDRAAVLDDTMDFLARARDDLATAYMGPIRESFAGLMDRMMGEGREKILVTPELEVRLERAGASRELAYFSAGQTDLIMLCMRLALVDALFREAKPFVILDDPFVNLDDDRTREALALLRSLSRDRQIIYLVCNSSRV